MGTSPGAGACRCRTPGLTLAPPLRQTLIGVGVVMVAAAVLLALPAPAGSGDFPADLLWSFRLGSLATQMTLYGGTALVFGLLSARDS